MIQYSTPQDRMHQMSCLYALLRHCNAPEPMIPTPKAFASVVQWAIDELSVPSETRPTAESYAKRDELETKLLDVLRLADELTSALDNEAEDIGGQRPSGVIVRELGPAVDAANEAVTEAAKELERE